jgi:uncharacterized membrane protein
MEAGIIVFGIAVIIGLCVGIWKFNEFIQLNYSGYSFLTAGKIAAISAGQLLLFLSMFFYPDSMANFYVLISTGTLIVAAVFFYNAKRTSVVLSAIGTFIELLIGAVVLLILLIMFSRRRRLPARVS